MLEGLDLCSQPKSPSQSSAPSLPQSSGPAGSADATLNPYSSKRRSGEGAPPWTPSHSREPLSSHPTHGILQQQLHHQKGPAPSRSRNPNSEISHPRILTAMQVVCIPLLEGMPSLQSKSTTGNTEWLLPIRRNTVGKMPH